MKLKIGDVVTIYRKSSWRGWVDFMDRTVGLSGVVVEDMREYGCGADKVKIVRLRTNDGQFWNYPVSCLKRGTSSIKAVSFALNDTLKVYASAKAVWFEGRDLSWRQLKEQGSVFLDFYKLAIKNIPLKFTEWDISGSWSKYSLFNPNNRFKVGCQYIYLKEIIGFFELLSVEFPEQYRTLME